MTIKPVKYRYAFLLPLAALLLIAAVPGDSYIARYLDVQTRTDMDIGGLTKALEQADLIFIGEEHNNHAHHFQQLLIIDQLHQADIDFAIGLEMFQAEQQTVLDRWIADEISENDFQRLFVENWRFPWPLYRDIFLYAREHQLPMVGLNVPREITAQVARHGFDSLSAGQLARIPGVSCSIDPKYEEFIRRALGGHHDSNMAFQNFCEAQMVWDSSMAHNLLEYRRQNPSRKLVVLAGGGHSWKYGIPEQIRRRGELSMAVILPESARLNRNTVTPADTDYLITFR